MPPRPAGTVLRVDDDAVDAPQAQMMRRRQSGLAGADDEYVGAANSGHGRS